MKCETCNANFSLLHLLKSHLRSHLRSNESVTCFMNDCTFVTHSYRSFNNHLSKHKRKNEIYLQQPLPNQLEAETQFQTLINNSFTESSHSEDQDFSEHKKIVDLYMSTFTKYQVINSTITNT